MVANIDLRYWSMGGEGGKGISDISQLGETIYQGMQKCLTTSTYFISIYKERGRFLVESVKVLCYKLKTVVER